ncbi:hypothetical protein Tco_0890056 [Tanacetum coccineum]
MTHFESVISLSRLHETLSMHVSKPISSSRISNDNQVNISTTNVILETIVKQKEETFQVVIDVVKNSTCIKAFTISADVLEILMQQFWYTITKIKGSESYEFLLADKRTTSQIYMNMCMDHMHQPWRTLASCINKCLSRKTASNDKLRKSRIDILWGMSYKENVDYPSLIWEYIAYQIDHSVETCNPIIKPRTRVRSGL